MGREGGREGGRAHLAVAKLQIVQTLRVGLLADVGLVHDEVTPSALLGEQHTRVVAP